MQKKVSWLLLILVLLLVGGIGVFIETKFELVPYLGKKVAPSPEATFVDLPSGPMDTNCLLLPSSFNPKEGSSFYKIREYQNALDTVRYEGQVGKVSTEQFKQGESACYYYKIELIKGTRTYNLYLPYRLTSVLEEGGNYVGDVEGKFLADLKGKTVEITMQFKREDNPTIPKFYIWKLRFL